MIPVLDSRAMRAADAAAIRGGVPAVELMETAARALCDEIARRFESGTRVAVVCGPGNNGGDGLAAARLLARSGLVPVVFTLTDSGRYRGEAAANLERAAAVGIAPVALTGPGGWRALSRALAECAGVVDALFGTGLSRPLEGSGRRAVRAIHASGKPAISADLPSGLSSDHGALLGEAVRAAATVAFGAPKPCHLLPPASGFCGALSVADIGIPRRELTSRARRFFLSEAADVRGWLPARPLESNKGTFGRVAVLAGSSGKPGAAILAARGALRAGAGLVTVFCPASVAGTVVGALPEAMIEAIGESGGGLSAGDAERVARLASGFDALVAGPGLGTAAGTVRFLEALLRAARVPVILDADGLNAFAGRPRWLARRRASTVVTPHPGEAGRLLSVATSAIQQDRLGAARRLARASGAVAVLKGARTLVADGRGDVTANATGTPLLATAGSGDVLSGILGALVAGGLAPREAAIAAVYLHGAAAEALTPRLGDAGLLAHEIADAVPGVRAALRAGPAPA